MQATIETFYETDEDYFDFEIDFEFSASYTPAKLDGPWENCHPAEGDSDFEILTVKQDGNEVEFDDLGSDVKTHICTSVNEWVEENGLQAIQEYNDELRAEAQMDADDFYDDFYCP